MKLIYKILFSLLIFFLLSEAAVRLLPTILSWEQIQSNSHVEDSKDKIRILTLGESTTAAYFATRADESWPMILEGKLNTYFEDKNIKFKVYNIARPGTNTQLIYERLKEDIAKYQPHIIVSMSGVNDGYQFYQTVPKKNLDYFLGGFKVFRIFKKLKIYKSDKILYSNMPSDYESRIANYMSEAIEIKAQDLWKIDDGYLQQNANYNLAAMSATTAMKIFKYDNFVKPQFNQKQNDMYSECVKYLLKYIESDHFHEGTFTGLFLCSQQSDVMYDKAIDLLISKKDQLTIDDMNQNILILNHKLLSRYQQSQVFEFIGIDDILDRSDNKTQFYLNKMYDLAVDNKTYFFAMMYPTGTLDYLYRIYGETTLPNMNFVEQMYSKVVTPKPIKPYLYFISNENFDTDCEPIVGKCYIDIWTRVLGGRFGHTTSYGHAMIAENAFQALLPVVQKIRPLGH